MLELYPVRLMSLVLLFEGKSTLVGSLVWEHVMIGQEALDLSFILHSCLILVRGELSTNKICSDNNVLSENIVIVSLGGDL